MGLWGCVRFVVGVPGVFLLGLAGLLLVRLVEQARADLRFGGLAPLARLHQRVEQRHVHAPFDADHAHGLLQPPLAFERLVERVMRGLVPGVRVVLLGGEHQRAELGAVVVALVVHERLDVVVELALGPRFPSLRLHPEALRGGPADAEAGLGRLQRGEGDHGQPGLPLEVLFGLVRLLARRGVLNPELDEGGGHLPPDPVLERVDVRGQPLDGLSGLGGIGSFEHFFNSSVVSHFGCVVISK